MFLISNDALKLSLFLHTNSSFLFFMCSAIQTLLFFSHLLVLHTNYLNPTFRPSYPTAHPQYPARPALPDPFQPKSEVEVTVAKGDQPLYMHLGKYDTTLFFLSLCCYYHHADLLHRCAYNDCIILFLATISNACFLHFEHQSSLHGIIDTRTNILPILTRQVSRPCGGIRIQSTSQRLERSR